MFKETKIIIQNKSIKTADKIRGQSHIISSRAYHHIDAKVWMGKSLHEAKSPKLEISIF